MLIYPPGDHLFRRQVCGWHNAWLVHDLQPVEVALVRGFVVEDDTNGVKWDDVAQCAHERLEYCLGSRCALMACEARSRAS